MFKIYRRQCKRCEQVYLVDCKRSKICFKCRKDPRKDRDLKQFKKILEELKNE